MARTVKTTRKVKEFTNTAHKEFKLEAKTYNQKQYVQAIENYSTVICTGPAGTGKTYISACKAAEYRQKHPGNSIVLIRPNVPCGRTLGFIPGDKDEKMLPWAAPVIKILEMVLGKGQVDHDLKSGRIEMLPIEHVRGRTFDNCFVIVDEAQNTTEEEVKAILTRHGQYTKMVIDGDIEQRDIKESSGLSFILSLVAHQGLPVPHIQFSFDDIQRGPECKMWLEAFSHYSKSRGPRDKR